MVAPPAHRSSSLTWSRRTAAVLAAGALLLPLAGTSVPASAAGPAAAPALAPAADDASRPHAAAGGPRTIVTTDPELDDLNSMIHMLLYSNEMRIEGLVYNSSQFHWAGDGKGTEFFKENREYTTPQTSWRWKPGQSHIEDAVDAYAKVYKNLRTHDKSYPTPAYLRSKYRVGNITFEGDTTQETDGSKLIEKVLLDNKPGPVYLQAWGGPSTIARALMSIEQKYKGTPRWDAIHQKVSQKAILTKFGSQDSTYTDYIKPSWPDLEMRDLATNAWGYFARSVVLPQDQTYLTASWIKKNVSSVGPLGELYRVWGDGKQMSPGDLTDFFGSQGKTVEELKAEGYNVWYGKLEDPGSWISEGDSSNWAELVDNGLRSYEDANYGGWGGRAQQNPEDPSEYLGSLAKDATPDGEKPNDYKTARFFRPMMNDFAARLQWSVTPRYHDANHEPTVKVAKKNLDIRVRPGQQLRLTSTIGDPDRDAVTARWWQYREAGTYPGTVDVSGIYYRGKAKPFARVTIPKDAEPGQTIHLVLEATDSGSPAMTSYQRVVATVR
jgi:hypothetical protein